MKTKTFILSILTLISIFNIVLSSNYMPLWLQLSIEVISIFLVINYFVKFIIEERYNIESKIKKLDDDFTKNAEDIKSLLNQQKNDFVDVITSNSKEITKQIQASNEKINIAISDEAHRITEQIASTSQNIFYVLESNINNATKAISVLIDAAKQAADEGTKSILQSTREQQESTLQKIDSISQQGILIQENIHASVSSLSAKSDSICETITHTNNEIKEQIASTSQNIFYVLESNINNATKAISVLIDAAKQAADEGTKSILQLTREQQESTLQKIDSISQQGILIQENIHASVSSLSAKSDSICETITHTNNEIKEQIASANENISRTVISTISNVQSTITTSLKDEYQKTNQIVNSFFKSCNEQYSSLLKLTTSIKEQNTTIATKVTEKEKDSYMSQHILSNIKNQCEDLNKGITTIKLKTENIEKGVCLLSENKTSSKIIESISTLISKLQATLQDSFSNINNQLLNTQISQETTNNELEKLQILSKTILKSFNEKSTNIPSAASEYSTHVQTSAKSSQVQNPKHVHLEPDPNRTETFFDNETKNVVINQYKNGNIIKSTMKNSNGHTLYELEYLNGKIIRSCNFSEKGHPTIEQTFYENGQVHYRHEYTSNGKIITEFDPNGKRK